MEKLSWKQVRQNDRNGSIPSLRWGHSCCIIQDQVFYFGGYADSNYMNDLWTFNTITMEWKEVQTSGDIPSHRSNCSMSYDQNNNRVIVFGGGGANKRRFNTISILDWKTKEWMEINPKPNESAPWERTYHTAELFYPYLVVFGGQGITDLDDLWIFDFITLSWKEVPIEKNAVRPSPRRFHSSVRIGNQFFVIAGCYAKYRCLSDIYSIDLTTFFQTGSLKGLQWVERKMKDNTFLTRWGHTSAVYEDKIYVYGGRFCNDLSDILILDPEKDQITNLKVYGDPPKARRRHSACFLGSSMLIFGGFNGQYFNDLHYININSSKRKALGTESLTLEKIENISKLKKCKTIQIKSKDSKAINIYCDLLGDRFTSLQNAENFFKKLQNQLTFQQLSELSLTLYRGYGQIQSQLRSLCSISIYDSKQQWQSQQKKQITLQQIGLIGKKRLRAVDPVIYLEQQAYQTFLQRMRQDSAKYDMRLNINNQLSIRVNKAKLAVSSQYFANIFGYDQAEGTGELFIPFDNPTLFQSLVHYLTTDFVVVSKQVDHKFWTKMAEIAEYFSLTHLLAVCQSELIGKVDVNCAQQLLLLSLDLNLSKLSTAAGEHIIKNMVNEDLQQYSDVFPEVGCEYLSIKREKVLKEVYSLLRFDILQKKIDHEYQQMKNSSKTIDSEGDRQQKQNFQAIS